MIYLDHAATSFPKQEAVYRAMDDAARQSLGNPGRAGHRLSRSSERILQRCRSLLCQFLGGEGPERFIFTLNGTDALNLAIKGTLQRGDHVVTGVLEHNSVLRPLAALQERGIIDRTVVGCDDEGYYRPEDFAAAVRKQTRLVVATHASNVLGTVQPIAEIGAVCREKGPLFLVDAAQSAGCRRLDLRRLPIDLLAAPGHKGLGGPTGTGLLYVGPRAEPVPWREGGTGGDSVDPLQPTDLPTRLEAGTPNVVGIAGLGAAVSALVQLGWDWIEQRETALAGDLRRIVRGVRGLRLLGEPRGVHERPLTATVSFVADWLPPAELAAVLDEQFDVAVRAGLHCAPLAHQAMGTSPDGAVRASAGLTTTDDELQQFGSRLQELASAFSTSI